MTPNDLEMTFNDLQMTLRPKTITPPPPPWKILQKLSNFRVSNSDSTLFIDEKPHFFHVFLVSKNPIVKVFFKKNWKKNFGPKKKSISRYSKNTLCVNFIWTYLKNCALWTFWQKHTHRQTDEIFFWSLCID